MKTSEFDYALPAELIAQTPVEPRDASRLLVIDRRTGEITHGQFRDLLAYLRSGDLLIGNDSRVIPARLLGTKRTGGAVEILLLRPVSATQNWECLVGGKGLRSGVQVRIGPTGDHAGITPMGDSTGIAPTGIRSGQGSPAAGTATILAETETGGRLVAFDPPLEGWLWNVGQVPLPPYIHHPLEDPERYQTVYSRIDGSVAASTAGLHFTPELLLQLRQHGVKVAFVTLHIGLDTFRPVQTEDIEEHRIHREWAELSAETARAVNQTRLTGGRIVAVGTTVVRVLESATKIAGFHPGDRIPADSLGGSVVAAFTGETDLFIRPGYQYRVVDALITNFHLPRSTLLMLVSAFAGKALLEKAYAEAIRERYRFYSFGDAMLIL